MVKGEERPNESMDTLVRLLEEALGNEKVIDKIAERVADRFCGRGRGRRAPDIRTVWESSLDKAGLKLDEKTTLENVVKLYPLSGKEIEDVVGHIKTSRFEGKLDIKNLRKFVIEKLGDNELGRRLAAAGPYPTPYPRPYPGPEPCGSYFATPCVPERYDCGAHFYCGRLVDCGSPFTCGLTYDCQIHHICDPAWYCDIIHACDPSFGCGPIHSCGLQWACRSFYDCSTYHCGPEHWCSSVYDCGLPITQCKYIHNLECGNLISCGSGFAMPCSYRYEYYKEPPTEFCAMPFEIGCPGFFDPIPMDWRERYIRPGYYNRPSMYGYRARYGRQRY